jgi:cytidylate kinase
MLFLYGPSGCSKSTLAKICALQAGYRPVFIDARLVFANILRSMHLFSEFPNAAKFRESFSETTGNAKIGFNSDLVCLNFCKIFSC